KVPCASCAGGSHWFSRDARQQSGLRPQCSPFHHPRQRRGFLRRRAPLLFVLPPPRAMSSATPCCGFPTSPTLPPPSLCRCPSLSLVHATVCATCYLPLDSGEFPALQLLHKGGPSAAIHGVPEGAYDPSTHGERRPTRFASVKITTSAPAPSIG